MAPADPIPANKAQLTLLLYPIRCERAAAVVIAAAHIKRDVEAYGKWGCDCRCCTWAAQRREVAR